MLYRPSERDSMECPYRSKRIALWFNTKPIIDGRKDGSIDYISAPAGFHTTGRILVWDPPHIFEHEWHIAPHPSKMPKGEPDTFIRRELRKRRKIILFSH